MIAPTLDAAATVERWQHSAECETYFCHDWNRGRIAVLETNGEHTQSPDTEQKREVMHFLIESFIWYTAVRVGQLQIARKGETVTCAPVLINEIDTELPPLLSLT